MASGPGATAVLRALHPSFKSNADKLALAVHAILSCDGLRLLAVGRAADAAEFDDVVKRSREEASLEGWNTPAQPGDWGSCYSFLYALPEEVSATTTTGSGEITATTTTEDVVSAPTLLVKALEMEGALMVSFLEEPPRVDCAPSSLELQLGHYCPVSEEHTSLVYAHLSELVEQVQGAVKCQTAATPAPTTPVKAGSISGSLHAVVAEELDALRDYSNLPARPPIGGWTDSDVDPLSVGSADLMPSMDLSGGFASPRSGRFDGSGGMLMGPGHPGFRPHPAHPAQPGHPEFRPPTGPGQPPGGPGPGMRWDPIAPQGLPGWNPDDFQRPPLQQHGRANIHPDVMQPGAGHGPSFDHMFG